MLVRVALVGVVLLLIQLGTSGFPIEGFLLVVLPHVALAIAVWQWRARRHAGESRRVA